MSLWKSFATSARGKWVLTGEHAVLRGKNAIAMPHPEFSLRLRFEPQAGLALEVSPPSAQAVVLEILKTAAATPTAERRGFVMPEGRLEIVSSIPIGAGLGSSAALCVAMSRWFADILEIRDSKGIFEFATLLEHRFHGRSSGMDVAVINADEPIAFSLQGSTALGIRQLPRFTFHDTLLRARTSDCVQRVGQLRERDPARGQALDDAMDSASRLAMEGLTEFDRAPGTRAALDLIARAMREAQECYYSWELVPDEARAIERRLLDDGALAVKLTGAGGGGMLVALWAH